MLSSITSRYDQDQLTRVFSDSRKRKDRLSELFPRRRNRPHTETIGISVSGYMHAQRDTFLVGDVMLFIDAGDELASFTETSERLNLERCDFVSKQTAYAIKCYGL